MPDMREEPPISSYGELWSDVEVRDEYLDGVWPVAKISYTHDVRRCLLIFTALSRRKEVSDRMLNLTREVIQHSSANYTAWYFRRLCLLKLKKDLKQELDYVRLCAEESEKNYQVWHHRRWVLLQLEEHCGDKQKSAEALYSDSKNYSAWAHRQWLVRRFGLWEGELEFVERMLRLDGRNNSAWNHRYFLLQCQPLAFYDQLSCGGATESERRVIPFLLLTSELR
eukprot:GHVQ01014593.1.p1 GENE.GHVQ01014593.1~~GHVQ01014593.1.p1  ORF type:complete len:225 (+),score=13.55 GHVQ01014593.1:272-946(+)